mgnify:CR=1 FL=1
MRSVCDFLFCVFFFQAEDGIRDLVRSRGLGDVYKRQGLGGGIVAWLLVGAATLWLRAPLGELVRMYDLTPVSYTHLTLPTSDLV